jgi:phosphopantothenoylcysteine decarboxylase / phosphopantothenate---cysteine ligase
MENKEKQSVILLGITGSIAAFKGVALASMLVKHGYKVIPVMTANGVNMIGTMSLEAITGIKPITDLFNYSDPLAHIHAGDMGDRLVIAPATANIIAKMATGIADDALSTLALRYPPNQTLIAPAMETDMYGAIPTQKNIHELKQRGIIFVDGVAGRLASGKFGFGRMAEPDVIFDAIHCLLADKRDLIGKKVLITAGPTRESIDPVRFISNHSSGKMGIELAKEARNRGALVELLLGPTYLDQPWGVKVDRFITTEQLLEMMQIKIPQYDILIMTAAVSDYQVKNFNQDKIAKGDLQIKFINTPDLLKETKALRSKMFSVGFALETSDGLNKARLKLENKGLDLIILNDLTTMNSPNIAFTIIDKNGKTNDFSKMDKALAATKILDMVLEKL